MAVTQVNGVRIHYEASGSEGAPLVLVHGSWGSLRNWDLVVPKLAKSFRVLTYDRRGHGASEGPGGQGSVLDDVQDLGALIESVGFAPAFVVGNSFGSSITARLAAERPDAFQGLVLHEPPLFGLLADDGAMAATLGDMGEAIGAVARGIESGNHTAAAEGFMEMALAPGEWERLPAEFRQTAIDNAPTFLDEVHDPDALSFDTDWVRGFRKPALLTLGGESPPQYAPVVRRLADAFQAAEVHTFAGLGHLPHVTDPTAYVGTVSEFVRTHAASPRAPTPRRGPGGDRR